MARILVKSSVRIPITSSLSNSDNLKASGNMIGDYRHQELILDEGTVIRIDAFSAIVKTKGYPATKITVFPDMGKSGTVYVSLDDLDGLSWESVDEVQKKPARVPTRRIDVSIQTIQHYDNPWHPVFKNRHYDTTKPDIVVINPLELLDDDFEKMMFTVNSDQIIGEAIVKIGRESWSYKVRYKFQHVFDLVFPDTGSSTQMKLLSAKFRKVDILLQISSNQYDSTKWEDVADNIESPDKFILAFLEAKHPKN